MKRERQLTPMEIERMHRDNQKGRQFIIKPQYQIHHLPEYGWCMTMIDPSPACVVMVGCPIDPRRNLLAQVRQTRATHLMSKLCQSRL